MKFNFIMKLFIIPLLVLFSFLFINYPLLAVSLFFLLILLFFSYMKPNNLPIIIILLVSGLVPYNRMPRIPLFGGGISLCDLGIFLGFLIVIFKILSTKYNKTLFNKSTMIKPLILLFAFVIISFLRTIFFHNSISLQPIFNELRPFVYLIITFFICLLTIRNLSEISKLIRSLIIICILMSLFQILEAKFAFGFTAADIRTAELEGGIVFSNINRATMPGISFLLLSFYFMILEYLFNKKFINIMACCLFMISILFSFGRMKFLTLVIGCFILIFLLPNNKKLKYLFTFLILVLILIFASTFNQNNSLSAIKDRFSSIISSRTYTGESLNWRYQENRDAINKLKGNLLFGIGLGREYRSLSIQRNVFSGALTYIHSGYLFLILKLGLIILIPIFWITLIFVRNCFKKSARNQFLTNLLSASFVTYLCLLLSSLTQPEFHNNASMVLFGILLYFSEFSNYTVINEPK